MQEMRVEAANICHLVIQSQFVPEASARRIAVKVNQKLHAVSRGLNLDAAADDFEGAVLALKADLQDVIEVMKGRPT